MNRTSGSFHHLETHRCSLEIARSQADLHCLLRGLAPDSHWRNRGYCRETFPRNEEEYGEQYMIPNSEGSSRQLQWKSKCLAFSIFSWLASQNRMIGSRAIWKVNLHDFTSTSFEASLAHACILRLSFSKHQHSIRPIETRGLSIFPGGTISAACKKMRRPELGVVGELGRPPRWSGETSGILTSTRSPRWFPAGHR